MSVSLVGDCVDSMITLFFANFQPLMECYVNLREKGTAINIHLTETWWRHYQVSLSDYENYLSSVPP